MSAMGLLSRRRRPPAPPPMAVPLDHDAHKPLGVRLAEAVRGLVTRRFSRSARRVLAWTCTACCIGVVAVGYLLQTSHVASLADIRGGLERDTLTVQDTNSRLTARAAESRALGRAEPVARSLGLRVAGPGNVAYLTAVDVPDPTALPRATATATPGTFARVQAALLGQGHADAPTPAPAGSAATATAVRAAAPFGLPLRPGTVAPYATPPLATLPAVPPTVFPSPPPAGQPAVVAAPLGTVPPLTSLPTPPRGAAAAATVAARGATVAGGTSTAVAPAARGMVAAVPTAASATARAARPPVIATALPVTPTTARAAAPAMPAMSAPVIAAPLLATSPAATLVTLRPAPTAAATSVPTSPTPAPMQPVTRASMSTTTGGRP